MKQKPFTDSARSVLRIDLNSSMFRSQYPILVLFFLILFIYPACSNEENSVSEVKAIHDEEPDLLVRFEKEEDLQVFSVSRSENISFVENSDSWGKVMRVDVPEGNHYGMEMDYLFDGVDEVYMSWQQYIPSHWTSADGTHMKFPGIGNRDQHGWGGRRADGTGGWSVRTGVRDRPAYNDSLSVEFYVYHMDMGDWGSVYSWDADENGATIFRGEWTEITNYVRVNTPGERDGIIRGWVNGNLAFEKLDIGLRAEGYEQYDIREIMWHVYHGGADASPLDQHILFRDLKIWLGTDSKF